MRTDENQSEPVASESKRQAKERYFSIPETCTSRKMFVVETMMFFIYTNLTQETSLNTDTTEAIFCLEQLLPTVVHEILDNRKLTIPDYRNASSFFKKTLFSSHFIGSSS